MMAFETIRARCSEILLATPEQRMYADVLDLLLEVFESEFGYFGYISTAGDLVCPSMTRNIFPACQVPDKDIVFRRANWGGLWGRILVERRSMIKNDAHKVPIGHLPIDRSFGSPIVFRDELIGQLHFANRTRDYDASDVELLERTCEFLAPVLNARLRHDEEQHARARLQTELQDANQLLRGKLAELERLTAALLDREERMIELKAEVERLKRGGS
jgi:GAF domain-containing protein|nr:GAF domain-containing protein [Kofleriaceae bacterium]